MYICYVCHSLFPNIIDLIVHIKKYCVDSNRVKKLYNCGQIGCSRFYDQIDSLRKHLVREHSASNDACTSIDTNMININETDMQTSIFSTRMTQTLTVLENSVGELVSLLYSNPTIPRNSIQTFMVVLEQFMAKYTSHVEDYIELVISQESSQMQVRDSLRNVFLASNRKISEFNTEYKRLKHFEILGTYVPSIEIEFATRNEIRGDKFHCVPVTQQIVPIDKVLKKFLSFDHILKEILDYKDYLSNFSVPLVNIIQGTVWKSKQFVDSIDILNFPLVLYCDDFEVNNPLGSHAGIQKLCGVYLSLPFLPPKLVSQLSNIFILSVFHASDRATYGNGLIFRSIIDQLNLLSRNGVEVNNKHFQGIIKFHVAAVTGDNLGLNSILGFVESFNANFFCRICTANKKQTQEMCLERESLLRSSDSYQRDVELNDVSQTGIKENCTFLELDHFSLFESVAVDTLHDYLEGCCRYVMKSLVKYLVQEKKFVSFLVLKNKVEAFDYGHDSSAKPSNALTLDASTIHVKASGSEMFTLVRYFGLIAGCYVPEEDEHWETFLLMRKLLDKLFLRRLYPSDVEQLEVLIEHFLDSYKVNFKDTLKPKFHFLTHYSKMVKKFGPLYQISTIRFESKHKVSKIAARSAISRVNVCKTVIIRNQLSLNNFFLQECSFDCLRLGLKREASPEISTILQTQFNTDSTFSHIKYFIKEGIRVQTSDIVTLDTCLDTGDPVLAQILSIYVDKFRNIFLKCSPMISLGFELHFHAFEVEHSGEEIFFTALSSLYSYVPNTLTVLADGSMYVTVREQL